MIPRFFCNEPMRVGAKFELPQEVAHHAVRVLRLRLGDTIVLFDGSGGEYRASLLDGGRRAIVQIEAFEPVQRESPLAATLVQALPAGDKMDWIIQKAVELGVTAIVPVIAERSVVRLSGERADKRAAHLRGVARSACEQCGRNIVPAVEAIASLTDFLAAAVPDDSAAPGPVARRRTEDRRAGAARAGCHAAGGPGGRLVRRGNGGDPRLRMDGADSGPARSAHRDCRSGSPGGPPGMLG